MKFLFGFLQLTFVPYFVVFFFLFPCTDRNLLTAHHLKSKGKFQNLALWMITSTLKIHHQATFARIFSNLWHLRVVSICAALEIGGGLNVQFASSKRGLVMKFAWLMSLCTRAFNKCTYMHNLVERQAIPELFRRLPLNSVFYHFCLEMNDIDFMRLSSISLSKRYQLHINWT